MPKDLRGHIERLPSGSYRVHVYAGTDPITRRQIRLRATAKDETQAQIELGKLLQQARDGRRPESGVTVAKLLDEYAAIAEWDLTTRQTNEGFIRRTIKPALGHLPVRKVHGPVLDKLYTRLRRCGDLSCTGHPFTEHRNIPALTVDPASAVPGWRQLASQLREAIESGALAPGDELPSLTELKRLLGIGAGVSRRALEHLAEEGVITARRGQAAVVAGEPAVQPLPLARKRPRPGHDCRRAGCRPHECHPMKPNTIRGIHSILSGAFGAAQRWGWTDWNAADSAKPPTATHATITATPPEDVARVIAAAATRSRALGLYLWLVAVTGVRRGELCAMQLADVDLERGLIRVAFNYVVRGSRKVRKDTKTHQTRWVAVDPHSCTLIAGYLDEIRGALAGVGVGLPAGAYLFSNDPVHARPWNPDWATHQVADVAGEAGVDYDIKGGRHYTASQLLAGGFDLRNTAARLGHSGGGATTLKHYADPVPEVDRRAAEYLARLTADAAPAS